MIHLKVNSTFKIKGFLRIRVYRKGILIKDLELENIITDAGLAEIRDMLKGKGFHPTHIAIGDGAVTGGDTPAAGDTILKAEKERDLITDITVLNEPADSTTREIILNRNVGDEVTALDGLSLTEAGLFNRYAKDKGTLISRIDITDLAITNKTPDTTFNVDWTFVISRDLVVGSPNLIVDNGLEIIRDLFAGQNPGQSGKETVNRHIVIPYLTHFAFGNGIGAPGSNETGLVGASQVLQLITQRDKDDTDPTAPKAIFQGFIAANGLAGGTTITEAGLFNRFQIDGVATDKLFSRVLLPNPTTGNITLTWTITVQRN